MSTNERRQRLLEVLCIRRHDTYDNLAHEFHVSKSTIRRDIAALTRYYPIITASGRYGGGVWIEEGFHLKHRPTLNSKQAAVLISVRNESVGERREVLNSIIELPVL